MAYALESDLDRTNVSVRELERAVADLSSRLVDSDDYLDGVVDASNELIDDYNKLVGWFLNVLSNLYDNPFPPATEAEWDEAHEVNWVIDRLSEPTQNHPNMALEAVEFYDGTIYHLRSYQRSEADCQCTCCAARKSQ